MTFTNIARAGFSAFNKKLTPLSGFTTDLSADVQEQGTTVQTRIVPVSSAAVSLSTATVSGGAGGDRSHANAVGDITTTAKTVTLNIDPVRGFYLTDEEADQIGSGVWTDTKDRLIAQTAYAVAGYILDTIFNLITNANFSTAVFTGAASGFDIDDVVDIATSLKGTSKWDLDVPTYMVLNSTYYGALKKDNAIQDLSASGIPVIGTGEVGRLDRFAVIEAPSLPPSGGTPETEHLTGFVSQKPAFAIAMRATGCQKPDEMAAYEIMTDPVTGVTMVYRAWYEPAVGKMYHTFEALAGATACQTEALKRIVSA
jgi:hypothetical protein